MQDSYECREDYISKSGDKWTSAPSPVTGRHRAEDILKRAGGPTLYARSHVENIKDTWRLIFTDKLLETITTATNREGYRIEGENFKQKTLSEIHTLLGIMYLRGIYQGKNEPMQSLWSVEYGRPIFNATMGYQRFHTLIRFLRFDDKGTRNQRYRNDKFAPIREFF